MSSHHPINEAEKLLVVRMNSRGYNVKNIVDATGYGSSTVYRILAKHRDTGDVVTRKFPAGRKRKLGAADVQVHVMLHMLALHQ